MCGIAGYYGIKNKQVLSAMKNAQSHRGPDADGEFSDGLVGLAHNRLSIIDLSDKAKQPMSSSDHNITVCFNGEIYNYQELKSDLIDKGYKFKTKTDTEVLIYGFLEWGDKLFDKLNGMFALAVYDKRDGSLRLVRDIFGIKPIHYSVIDEGQLIFASEIQSLLATKLFTPTPNDKTIYRYLSFRVQDDSEETFFSNILRVEPGTMLVIDKKGIKKKRYTNYKQELLKQATDNRSYSEKVERFKKLLAKSIDYRLQSDVPVGTSLSGGLDSSSVAALIATKLNDSKISSIGKKQNTFSAVFPNYLNDESDYVDAFLSKYNNISSHKIKPTAESFSKEMLDFVKSQGEPTISTGPYAQYKVMQEASKHVTVVLDGQGADETMAGYIPYYFVYLRQLWKEKKHLLAIKEFIKSLDVIFRLGRFTLKDKLTFRKKVSVKEFLSDDFKKQFKDQKLNVINDNLKQRLADDLFKNSIPSLLRYEDRNTMRFGIEGRVPFLDRELVKYIFSLDDSDIIRNGVNKFILHSAMKEKLPNKILNRRNKTGFTNPEQQWIKTLKKDYYTIFNSESFGERKYFDADKVLMAFEGFIHGQNDANTMLFWRFINLELWLREFIDPKNEQAKITETKKGFLEPNQDKKTEITVGSDTFDRYPIQTEKVSDKTNINNFVANHLEQFVDQLQKGKKQDLLKKHDWYFYISEKIVAISQKRSYFIWDIEAGFWAKRLSKLITRTPAGIGLGSPWTMEVAIREAGLPRILWATLCGAIGKLIGKRGWFYIAAGANVRAIDGPTKYSVFPANVSAKLPPKDPDNVAKKLSQKIAKSLPKQYTDNFKGVVVIDANDIGQNALGNSTNLKMSDAEDVFKDNPLGQAKEQTPIAIVVKQ